MGHLAVMGEPAGIYTTPWYPFSLLTQAPSLLEGCSWRQRTCWLSGDGSVANNDGEVGGSGEGGEGGEGGKGGEGGEDGGDAGEGADGARMIPRHGKTLNNPL